MIHGGHDCSDDISRGDDGDTRCDDGHEADDGSDDSVDVMVMVVMFIYMYC